MLILNRMVDEKLIIRCPNGDTITIMVTDVSRRRGGATLGITAPQSYIIGRVDLPVGNVKDSNEISN